MSVGPSGAFLKGGFVHRVRGQRFLSAYMKRRRCSTALRSHASAGVGAPLSLGREALECSGPQRIRGFESAPRYSRLVVGSSAEIRFPVTATVGGAVFIDALLGVGGLAEPIPNVDVAASVGASCMASIFCTDLSINSDGEVRLAMGLREEA